MSQSSDNNKRIAKNTLFLLPNALYDGGVVICKSYYKIKYK